MANAVTSTPTTQLYRVPSTTFRWRLTDFAHKCAAKPNKGDGIKSDTFEWEGYRWRLAFYPHGCSSFPDAFYSSIGLHFIERIDQSKPEQPMVMMVFIAQHPTGSSKTIRMGMAARGLQFRQANTTFACGHGAFLRFADYTERGFIAADSSVTFVLELDLITGASDRACSAGQFDALKAMSAAAVKTASDCSLQLADGTSIPAHRAFLSARSAFFKAAFSSGLGESKDGVIKLPAGIDASTARLLLKHGYSGWLPRETDSIAPDSANDGERAAKRQKTGAAAAAAAASLDDDESASPAAGGALPLSQISAPPPPWAWSNALALFSAADFFGLHLLAVACVPILARTIRVDNLPEAMGLARRFSPPTAVANAAASSSSSAEPIQQAHARIREMVSNFMKRNIEALLDSDIVLSRPANQAGAAAAAAAAAASAAAADSSTAGDASAMADSEPASGRSRRRTRDQR